MLVVNKDISKWRISRIKIKASKWKLGAMMHVCICLDKYNGRQPTKQKTEGEEDDKVR